MKKALKKAQANNKGFTLVELIIVIAIIAVLAAVLAPQYIQYVENSREATDKNAVSEIAHAAEVAAVGDGTKVPTSTTMTVKISKDGALTYGTGDLDTAVKGVVAEGSYTFKSKKYKGTAGHDITITLTNGKAGWTEPA